MGQLVDGREEVFGSCEDFIHNEKEFYPFIYVMPMAFPQQLERLFEIIIEGSGFIWDF